MIENEFLKLKTNEMGGHLSSIFDKKKNTEIIYQPLEKSWQGQDIFIFPFIARLKDGFYIYKGKRYEFKNHGLIRYMKGEYFSNNENEEGYIFRSDFETKERYPFDFVATVKYKLNGNEIECEYSVRNCDNEEMPFEIGMHPAFLLPGSFKSDVFEMKDNKIVFNGANELVRLKQDDTFSFMTSEKEIIKNNEMDLSKDLFRKINTYIFESKNINNIVLYKKDNSKITLNFNHSQFIAVWSDNYYGNYVCIEPWSGLPDYIDPKREISEKPFMKFLKPGKTFKYSYSIKVN